MNGWATIKELHYYINEWEQIRDACLEVRMKTTMNGLYRVLNGVVKRRSVRLWEVVSIHTPTGIDKICMRANDIKTICWYDMNRDDRRNRGLPVKRTTVAATTVGQGRATNENLVRNDEISNKKIFFFIFYIGVLILYLISKANTL